MAVNLARRQVHGLAAVRTGSRKASLTGSRNQATRLLGSQTTRRSARPPSPGARGPVIQDAGQFVAATCSTRPRFDTR